MLDKARNMASRWYADQVYRNTKFKSKQEAYAEEKAVYEECEAVEAQFKALALEGSARALELNRLNPNRCEETPLLVSVNPIYIEQLESDALLGRAYRYLLDNSDLALLSSDDNIIVMAKKRGFTE